MFQGGFNVTYTKHNENSQTQTFKVDSKFLKDNMKSTLDAGWHKEHKDYVRSVLFLTYLPSCPPSCTQVFAGKGKVRKDKIWS